MKGWATASEPVTAAPNPGATIIIRFDPDDAALVSQAARLLGGTKSDLVRETAIAAAPETIERANDRHDRQALA